jgi:hypothetical protein
MKKLIKWVMPNNYSGSTFFDYYRTGIGQSRDSDCLERANFAAMLEKLGGESETVIVNRSGHWAVGWVESILIHESNIEKLKIADEIMEKFDDYPVINNTTLSEVENDELQSTIDCYQNDFRSTVCELLGQDFNDLNSQEQDEVDAFISEVMYEDMGYRGIEDAFVTDDSIIRGIESSKYWSECSNLVVFLQKAFNVEQAG